MEWLNYAIVGAMWILAIWLMFWTDKRWPGGYTADYDSYNYYDYDDIPSSPYVIQYPLDDRPWPKKDGLDDK